MRFRTIALSAALTGAAAMFAGAAYADDPMANTYGNTVVTKDEATGVSSKLMFNQDMSYTGETVDKDGKPVSYSGTWALKDDGKTICLTPTAPANAKEAPTANCSPLIKHAVGDNWTVSNDQKQTFDVSIMAGR